MPIRLSDEVRVAILIGDEEITAVFPSYSNPEMAAALKSLATGRTMIGRGGQAKDKSYDARVRFFNAMCSRVEGVEMEDGKALSPEVENWRSYIPANWKISFSLYFEEKATLSDEEVGN